MPARVPLKIARFYALSISSNLKRTTAVLVPQNNDRPTIFTWRCSERSRRFKRHVHDKIATSKALLLRDAGDSEAVAVDLLYVKSFPLSTAHRQYYRNLADSPLSGSAINSFFLGEGGGRCGL